MIDDRTLDNHILNIIQNHDILEQSDLQKLLHQRGYDFSQATLSRRLKKLQIAKISGVYRVVDFNPSHLPLVLNISVSDFGLIVLHTHPGHGNSLAYFLDQKYVAYSPSTPKKSGMLGTIAGDDTVLLVVKSQEDLTRILSLLFEDFPYLKS